MKLSPNFLVGVTKDLWVGAVAHCCKKCTYIQVNIFFIEFFLGLKLLEKKGYVIFYLFKKENKELSTFYKVEAYSERKAEKIADGKFKKENPEVKFFTKKTIKIYE